MLIVASKDTPAVRAAFRALRDRVLTFSDAYMMPDRGFTEDQIAEITTWRQALRDATLNGAPANEWTLPTPPDFVTASPT